MTRESKFTPVDLHTWERGQIFYYFSKMAPTGYASTVKQTKRPPCSLVLHGGFSVSV